MSLILTRTRIIAALRKAGICAHSTAALGNGFPDICWGYRGLTGLLEVKTGSTPSDRRLTSAEQGFGDAWAGCLDVVSTPSEALGCVVDAAKRWGAL